MIQKMGKEMKQNRKPQLRNRFCGSPTLLTRLIEQNVTVNDQTLSPGG